MIKTSAWSYLDKMVTRRNSIEFRKMVASENFAVCANGFYFGIGPTCKAALIDAIKDTKRRKTDGH